MADQMQTIKRRMKSVRSTERITNAMKLVSAAKLKQASNQYEHIQKNISRITKLFQEVLEREQDAPGGTQEQNEGQSLYVVFTGSKGLCGNFNASVIKMLEQTAEEDREKHLFLPLGNKGKEYCFREGLTVLDVDGIYSDTMTYEEIQDLSKELLFSYQEGKIAEIKFIHASYLNSVSYDVRIKQILPLQVKDAEESGFLMEYEKDRQTFFSGILEEYIALCIFSVLSESALCEHSARRIAMKNASDNAKELLTELSVNYNRARQAAITNEIIEIIAGAERQRTRR